MKDCIQTATRNKKEAPELTFGGRTDKAEIPIHLKIRLSELFFEPAFGGVGVFEHDNVVLYGEGYGHKIQSGGKYLGEDVDFVLFDVKVGNYWLERKNVDDVAKVLGIRSVPVVGHGTIQESIDFVKAGFQSTWGNFTAEGLVIRPTVDMFNRKGERIITKIKHRDFM